MKIKVALTAALAFCMALLVGRMILSPITHSVASAKGEPVALPGIKPGPQKVSAPAPSQEISQALMKSDMLAKQGVERNFKAVDGGVLNDNKRMSHFISSIYQEGSLHKAANGFGETVRWLPQAEELRRGHDVLGVLGSAGPVRGELLALKDCNHYLYRSTYPDTDEQMYIRPEGGIEHDITLKQAPQLLNDSDGVAYTGYLQLGKGLTLWDGDHQITAPYSTKRAVQIKNMFKNTVFVLRPPVAWDASVTGKDGSLDKEKQAQDEHIRSLTACEYQFDFEMSGIKLAVVTPGKWLMNKERAYPVVIDPNLGLFGLADGSPPIYEATQGSDTEISASSGGSKIPFPAAAVNPGGFGLPGLGGGGVGTVNPGFQTVALPFAFTYYNTVFNAININIAGYATFQNANAASSSSQNQPLPAAGNYAFTMFPYWSDLTLSGDPTSGVYFFTEGVSPSRRFIIEWHKMRFNQNTSNTNNTISFNLILSECTNVFEFIIGTGTDVDQGFATVGEQGPVNNKVTPPVINFIQFDFDSSAGNGLINPATGTVTPFPPISPGTSLTFNLSATSGLVIGPTSAAGCLPFTVCFTSTILPPPNPCATIPATTPTVGFHWVFGDNSEAFTPNVCHTFVSPGAYQVALTVTDELGIQSTLPPIPVQICDRPAVTATATPQGGTAPLNVSLDAVAFGVNAPGGVLAATPTPGQSTIAFNTPPVWYVDLLGSANQPNQATRITSGTGAPFNVELDLPGLYKATVNFNGTDNVTGLATGGVGIVFIFVAAPTDVVTDACVITSSQFHINWVSKQPLAAANLPAPNPNGDSLNLNGILSLPGISMSQLLGLNCQIILNGTQTIFQGTLDASGHAAFGTQAIPPGPSGDFQIDLPSGVFSLNVTGDLFVTLGLVDNTEQRMVAANFQIEIQNIFPPANFTGAVVTYDYLSQGFLPGPPASGQAVGTFNFGGHSKAPFLKGTKALGRPGGFTRFESGVFTVTNAKFTLLGNTVFADIQGMLARYGGDSLLPTATSDVVVQIGGSTSNGNVVVGGYSETLNFSTTPKFKTTGRVPRQTVNFKRDKSLGGTGVSNLTWSSLPGTFRIKTNGIPNDGPAGVGINPALGIQTLVVGLTITPADGQVFRGVARFDVLKATDTEYVHSSKKFK